MKASFGKIIKSTNKKTQFIYDAGTEAGSSGSPIILAKGHNFNDLNLVVITNVDYMLYSEDFRALEHTFQLLNQVSGRAGRLGNIESKVIIQSYNMLFKILKKNLPIQVKNIIKRYF